MESLASRRRCRPSPEVFGRTNRLREIAAGSCRPGLDRQSGEPGRAVRTDRATRPNRSARRTARAPSPSGRTRGFRVALREERLGRPGEHLLEDRNRARCQPRGDRRERRSDDPSAMCILREEQTLDRRDCDAPFEEGMQVSGREELDHRTVVEPDTSIAGKPEKGAFQQRPVLRRGPIEEDQGRVQCGLGLVVAEICLAAVPDRQAPHQQRRKGKPSGASQCAFRAELRPFRPVIPRLELARDVARHLMVVRGATPARSPGRTYAEQILRTTCEMQGVAPPQVCQESVRVRHALLTNEGRDLLVRQRGEHDRTPIGCLLPRDFPVPTGRDVGECDGRPELRVRGDRKQLTNVRSSNEIGRVVMTSPTRPS